MTARIKDLDRKIPAVLDRLGCTLTTTNGIGAINAMELLVEIGDPCRFTTEAHFARWCGAAPSPGPPARATGPQDDTGSTSAATAP